MLQGRVRRGRGDVPASRRSRAPSSRARRAAAGPPAAAAAGAAGRLRTPAQRSPEARRARPAMTPSGRGRAGAPRPTRHRPGRGPPARPAGGRGRAPSGRRLWRRGAASCPGRRHRGRNRGAARPAPELPARRPRHRAASRPCCSSARAAPGGGGPRAARTPPRRPPAPTARRIVQIRVLVDSPLADEPLCVAAFAAACVQCASLHQPDQRLPNRSDNGDHDRRDNAQERQDVAGGPALQPEPVRHRTSSHAVSVHHGRTDGSLRHRCTIVRLAKSARIKLPRRAVSRADRNTLGTARPARILCFAVS